MHNKILVYVEAAFAIVYLAGGFFLLLGPTLFQTRTFQTIFGILLLAYSGFRFFRAYQKLKQNDHNQDS
jgi:positive regulator of sigma E activity